MSGAIEFVSKCESITLYSPYLKLKELKYLNHEWKIKRIIVRWEIKDLAIGVSDPEVYQYCLENNIALFRNTRIHLKAFWNQKKEIFFGSANITGRGIGEFGDYNYELNGNSNDLQFRDEIYLQKIIDDSEYVDERLFNLLKSTIEDLKITEFKYPEIPTKKKNTDLFLISQLPMTSNPEVLFHIYHNKSDDHSEYSYAIHDIVTYRLPNGLSSDAFIATLKENFNNHAFIKCFKSVVKKEESSSMRFGAVRQWFARNTTTVPTPRAWELSDFISILYEWICYFDDEFSWEVPGQHSQVLFFRNRQNI